MCDGHEVEHGVRGTAERHDGQAVTCEDFVRAMEEAADVDLTQFRRWYSQAGTPVIGVRDEYDEAAGSYTLHVTQSCPPTPGQPNKEPFVIPLAVGLLGDAGNLPLKLSGRPADPETKDNTHLVLTVDQPEQTFVFEGVTERPVPSLLRGFSAPVTIERNIPDEELVFLAAKDDDSFARYEAMQELVVRHLTAASGDGLDEAARESARTAIATAFGAILNDEALDDSMRGELMMLPSLTYLAEQQLVADPGAIHTEREGLKAWLGNHFSGQLAAMHDTASRLPFSLESAARGARKIKTQALVYLAAGDPAQASIRAAEQYDAADNMTDRQGALMVLAGLETPAREEKLADFLERYKDNELVVDKWFTLQASSLHRDAIDHVKTLAKHPEFNLRNPNRVRSLYMAFAANPYAFHSADGEGYRMIADLILALDPINPQTAARFVPPLGRWRRIEPRRAALMRAELERIAAAQSLSRDTFEQVSRSLEG